MGEYVLYLVDQANDVYATCVDDGQTHYEAELTALDWLEMEVETTKREAIKTFKEHGTVF